MSTPVVPLEWQIQGLGIILPPLWTALGHIRFPFLLNPFIISSSH